MKCFTERGGNRWRAIDAGELPTVPKCIGGSLGFFKPPELRKGCRQQRMGDTVGRID
jgi:hypothetical protein